MSSHTESRREDGPEEQARQLIEKNELRKALRNFLIEILNRQKELLPADQRSIDVSSLISPITKKNTAADDDDAPQGGGEDLVTNFWLNLDPSEKTVPAAWQKNPESIDFRDRPALASLLQDLKGAWLNVQNKCYRVKKVEQHTISGQSNLFEVEFESTLEEAFAINENVTADKVLLEAVRSQVLSKFSPSEDPEATRQFIAQLSLSEKSYQLFQPTGGNVVELVFQATPIPSEFFRTGASGKSVFSLPEAAQNLVLETPQEIHLGQHTYYLSVQVEPSKPLNSLHVHITLTPPESLGGAMYFNTDTNTFE